MPVRSISTGCASSAERSVAAIDLSSPLASLSIVKPRAFEAIPRPSKSRGELIAILKARRSCLADAAKPAVAADVLKPSCRAGGLSRNQERFLDGVAQLFESKCSGARISPSERATVDQKLMSLMQGVKGLAVGVQTSAGTTRDAIAQAGEQVSVHTQTEKIALVDVMVQATPNVRNTGTNTWNSRNANSSTQTHIVNSVSCQTERSPAIVTDASVQADVRIGNDVATQTLGSQAERSTQSAANCAASGTQTRCGLDNSVSEGTQTLALAEAGLLQPALERNVAQSVGCQTSAAHGAKGKGSHLASGEASRIAVASGFVAARAAKAAALVREAVVGDRSVQCGAAAALLACALLCLPQAAAAVTTATLAVRLGAVAGTFLVGVAGHYFYRDKMKTVIDTTSGAAVAGAVAYGVLSCAVPAPVAKVIATAAAAGAGYMSKKLSDQGYSYWTINGLSAFLALVACGAVLGGAEAGRRLFQRS